MTSSIKQSAEKLGISLSHYDIDGHLIYASPSSIDYFIEQLQFPPNTGQNQLFQDVICAFENEPSKTKFSLKKQFHIQPHFRCLLCLLAIIVW